MPNHDYYLPQRTLVSQQDQALIPQSHTPRSRFSGSWTRKTAFDAGYLVPFLVDEVIPGDHMKYNVTAFIRMATPLLPLLDSQRVDTFFFFVPNRILWTNWTKFMGEQTNPGDSIAYNIPTQTWATLGYPVGSLHDHMGLPTIGQSAYIDDALVSSLPFRAYNQIYNAWFRDENLINSVTKDVGDGPDSYSNYNLLRRAKSHDYFTSALPWTQKFTAPTIALVGTAPIKGLGWNPSGTHTSGSQLVNETVGNPTYTEWNRTDLASNVLMESDAAGRPKVYADLASASGISVNALRQAWLIQSLYERDARGGTRYIEIIKSHFGVTSPDFRLQRPEYIGGGKTPLSITPIAQTAPTAGVPLGALGGAGAAAGQHTASYAATEHGYILGLINIKTELSYQQGIARHWTRKTRYDFYWPALAELGEQAILRQEIYATPTIADNQLVFGYQERYHEYRTRYSEVTGIMRSTAAGTIDGWHLAQKFATAPTLGQTFIEDTPPMLRVLAAGASTNQQYLADIHIQRDAVRPIPAFSVPAQLGRF